MCRCCVDLFVDGDDLSWENIEKGRNNYYQREMANQISIQTSETLSLLTAAVNIHLNIGQNLSMNTSALLMSLETTSIQSLSNRSIQQTDNAHFHIPTHFEINATDNTSITLRVSCDIGYIFDKKFFRRRRCCSSR